MAIFYEEVLTPLLEQNVHFVIVGGTAVVLHGVPRMTADLDIVIDLERGNVEKLVTILATLDPARRREWYEEKGMLAFSFWHPERPLDAVNILYAGCPDCEALSRCADYVSVGRLSLAIASIADLIAMKEDTGRPQDAADIDALRRLLDVQAGN